MTTILRLILAVSMLSGCATVDPYAQLQTAVRMGHLTAAESLLKTHASDLNATDTLIVAAEVGDSKAAQRFLAQKRH